MLARRYAASENTLYRRRDEFMTAGEAALADGRGKLDARDLEISELRKQLGQRDRVIGELTIANRILKKNGGRAILTEDFRGGRAGRRRRRRSRID